MTWKSNILEKLKWFSDFLIERIEAANEKEAQCDLFEKINGISTDGKGDTYIRRKNSFGLTRNIKLQKEGYATNMDGLPCRVVTDGKTRYFLPIVTYGTQAERDHLKLQQQGVQSDKDSYNSYGYTPEQISEILRNYKIKEVEKLTTDQILQQHPFAMDYSRGFTRDEIADVIRVNELIDLKTEPLYGKRQEPSDTLNKNYGYTPEQISEILRNHKIKEVEKLTTDQILQQHPFAMDYSRGFTRDEIADVIRVNELIDLKTEPLYGKRQEAALPLSARREKRGELSEERKVEAARLRQKMLGNTNGQKREKTTNMAHSGRATLTSEIGGEA